MVVFFVLRVLCVVLDVILYRAVVDCVMCCSEVAFEHAMRIKW